MNRTPPTGGSGVTATKRIQYNINVGSGVSLLEQQNTFYKEVVQNPVFTDEQEAIENLRQWCAELESEIEALKREKLDKYSKGVTFVAR